jgi:hypothetical protein
MTTVVGSSIRVLLFSLVALAFAAVRPDIFVLKDFPEYWAAAHVLAHSGDPYDGAQLLRVQQAIVGSHLEQATSLWTPPWTLPLYLPFGFLPFAIARYVWLGVQLLMVFAAGELLGRTYSARRVLPQLLALTFAPVFWMALFGQNTGFLLLGLAGFLHFRERQPFVAGVFAALTAIKPHLLAVFGVVLILDAFRRDGWKVLAAGTGVLAAGSLVAVLMNDRIFELFAAAVQRPKTPEVTPLSEWDLPLIAHQFRHAIDPHQFGIQFVPCAVACGLMAVHKLWQGNRWNWRVQLPPVVLVSCLCAPYGGWMFDLVVLLVPTIHAVAVLCSPTLRSGEGARGWGHSRLIPLAILLGYFLLMLFGFLIRELAEPIWFTPALAALYLGAVVPRWLPTHPPG